MYVRHISFLSFLLPFNKVILPKPLFTCSVIKVGKKRLFGSIKSQLKSADEKFKHEAWKKDALNNQMHWNIWGLIISFDKKHRYFETENFMERFKGTCVSPVLVFPMLILKILSYMIYTWNHIWFKKLKIPQSAWISSSTWIQAVHKGFVTENEICRTNYKEKTGEKSHNTEKGQMGHYVKVFFLVWTLLTNNRLDLYYNEQLLSASDTISRERASKRLSETFSLNNFTDKKSKWFFAFSVILNFTCLCSKSALLQMTANFEFVKLLKRLSTSTSMDVNVEKY